jgi:hypothetical protein
MRKAIFIFLLCIAATASQAQYKQAGGYFGKTGRTYGLGGSLHFMGDDKGAPYGITFSIGREQEEKRWFNWTMFTVVPPINFSYQTMAAVDNDNFIDPVTVTGKTKLALMADVNWGVFLHNVSNTDARLKPYLSFGINAQVMGGINEESSNRESFAYNYYSLQKEPVYKTIGMGIKGGAGAILMFNEKLGIKADVGYNLFGNLPYQETGYGHGLNTESFYSYVSNPYVNIGLQIAVLGKD